MSGDEQRFIIADFNNDGLCDYIIADSEGKNLQLHGMKK
jgi:hypothetical protein